MGHGFAILLPHVGTLRPFGAPAPVNSALGRSFAAVRTVSVKVVDASSFKLFMLLGAPCLVG